ncbi:hypothetical protein [Paenibacillus tepidiphilus]|uniref:hypothetical protein n=1 Tax=Paenibacillus tepidiphilus TaxID=2608683 RepID=UPI0012390A4B|nr:hypothetical protein [Paenibacillus tepidiphilus]
MKHGILNRLALPLLACICLAGCSSGSTDKGAAVPDHVVIYENPRFNFGVSFPQEWSYEEFGTENYESTADREGLPDSGIKVSVDNQPEEQISIFGQLGLIGRNNPYGGLVEDFETGSGLKGRQYIEEHTNFISIYFAFDNNQLSAGGYTGSLGGSIEMSKEMYNRYKGTIAFILESIRITE